MSKVHLMAMNKRDAVRIKTTLQQAGVFYREVPHGLFECMEGYMFLELSTQNSLSYNLTNLYEIYGNAPSKKEFDKSIDCFKDILLGGISEILLCVKWLGNNAEELNETYEETVINLADYVFPEDKFEFSFNVMYKFIYNQQ